MKKFSMILTLVLALSMLAGCAGTTVVYQTNCTCPVGSHDVAVQETPATEAPATETPVAVEGAVKTGLAVVASIKITDPTAEADGKASYDVTYAAVNVDENGVITACKFDSVGTDVAFDAAGVINTADGEVLTKHELGDNYGMGAFAPAGEWYVQANALAEEQGMDLVKISPNAVPPVCKIMDYSKFCYDQKKREKDAKKNQKVVEVKEIRMSPSIDTNDLNTKIRAALKFLADGNRVKVSVRFRGREMAHQQIGMEVLNRVKDDLQELAVVESFPTKIEGRQMIMVLAPKKKQ